MPRAFLIKKKGRMEVPTGPGEGELNNNTDLPASCLENKENMEERVPLVVVEEEEAAEEAGRKEAGRQLRERKRREQEQMMTDLSPREESLSPQSAPDKQSPAAPRPQLPADDVVQQFPTDLSLKATSTSAPTSSPVTSQLTAPSEQGVRVVSPGSRSCHRREGAEAHYQTGSWRPCKRPSDFSAAFLLSHHSAPKRSQSLCRVLVSPECPSPFVSSAAASSTPTPVAERRGHPGTGLGSSVRVEDCRDEFVQDKDMLVQDSRPTLPQDLAIPSPSKLLAPCLSMSMCLEHQPASPMLASAYQMSRNREDRVSTSSSLDPPSPGRENERCFPSPLGPRREEGPSAFRRNDSKVSRDLTWARKDSEETKTTSPQTVVDRGHDMSPRDRRGLSTSPRDSVFASPQELMSPSLLHARLAAGESRRGSSTSPAHSEHTSSGCGSPADSSGGSPPGQPSRYTGDLPWGQTAPAFLPLSSQSHHPFVPMGLRYFPGIPMPPGLTKPLPDMPLPFNYPKSLPEGLDSAFRSPRPPFVHPAAAAYYSSLRSPFVYPFFLSTGSDRAGKTSPKDEVGQHGADRLDMLRALRKGSADPLSAFQDSPPSLQPSHIPSAGGAVISPRPSQRTSSQQESVTGRTLDLKELPRGLGIPAAAAVGVDNLSLKSRSKDREPVRYQCEACSKSYSTFSGLSKHKQFHCTAQLKKEFSCKHCDKTYVSLGALKMHIRTHTLPCKCTVCGKAFSRPWLLQGHLRTHTGEKPFSCPHCARAFADRSNLRAHLQTHSDVKKYSCRHCSKTFSRMSLLLKHEDVCCNNNI